jgi:hypothetical protein
VQQHGLGPVISGVAQGHHLGLEPFSLPSQEVEAEVARRLLDRFPPLTGAGGHVAGPSHEGEPQVDSEVAHGCLVVVGLLARAQHVVEVGHRQLDVQLLRQAGEDEEERYGVLSAGYRDEDTLAGEEDTSVADEAQDAPLQAPGEGGDGPGGASGLRLIF